MNERAWQKIGRRPHHGICLPLSALHSKAHSGFHTLIPLIDWCAEVGFDCIQLLPILDTGADSSPYSLRSSFALNPVYLSQEASKDLYPSFLEKSRSWLDPYARFLAEKEGVPPDATCLLQYQCWTQMRSVKEHAEKKGVFLMGDLPLLVCQGSADVWASPHLFDSSRTAGAPPDYYNPDGQRWGFPLPNIDAMRKEHFSWWKERVRTAGEFFHLYRIDHFVGLFRLWSFFDETSPEGAFVPPDETLWQKQAEEILDAMLSSSDMLPMAEDLGIIPPMVEKTLHRYEICGMAVLRWQRRWESDKAFLPYKKYHPLNLTTVSTHDSEPLALWWKNVPEEASLFAAFKHWVYTPMLGPWQRKEILRDAHHTPTFFHINLLQEYLALFPELVHSTPEEERINTPGTISPNNWSYRFKPSVEEIAAHPGLAASIRDILQKK